MTHSVIRTAEEIERLETIARLTKALLAHEGNKVMTAYRLTLEPLLKDVK
jgi:hypothetical protein